jgi:hypothetical protein
VIKLNLKISNQKMRIKMKNLRSCKNMGAIEIKSQIFKKMHILIFKVDPTQNKINKMHNLTNKIKNNKTFRRIINFIKLRVKINSKK